MSNPIREVLEAAAQKREEMRPRIELCKSLLVHIPQEMMAVQLITMSDLLTRAKAQREEGKTEEADKAVDLVRKLLLAYIGEIPE